MKSFSPLLAVVPTLAVLAAAAWWFFGRDATPEIPPSVPQSTPPADAQPVPAELKARMPAPNPQVSVDTTAGYVRLPDGTFIPNLNGVKSHAKLAWGAGPFSPIDYKMVDAAGIEWYVLENGDQLTTVRWPGTENGEKVMRDIIVRHQRKEALPAASAEQLKALKRK